jgi:integrase
VQRLVEKLARLAGIAHQVTPHTLRRTFATRFLRKGRSFGRPQDRPGVLQALLGHANLVTTARYLHPDKAQVQAMVEEM